MMRKNRKKKVKLFEKKMKDNILKKRGKWKKKGETFSKNMEKNI